jgi:hypothetical protein
LQQLQSTELGKLLDGLLAASPSAAADAQSLVIRALGDDSAEARSLLPLSVSHRFLPSATPPSDSQVREMAASKGKAAIEAGGAKAAQLLPVLVAFLDVDAQRVLSSSRSASMPSLAAAAANGSAARPASAAESRQVRIVRLMLHCRVKLTLESSQDRVKAGVIGLLGALSSQLSAENVQALLSRLTAWLSAPSDLIQQALGAALPGVIAAAALGEDQRREIVSALLQRVRA